MFIMFWLDMGPPQRVITPWTTHFPHLSSSIPRRQNTCTAQVPITPPTSHHCYLTSPAGVFTANYCQIYNNDTIFFYDSEVVISHQLSQPIMRTISVARAEWSENKLFCCWFWSDLSHQVTGRQLCFYSLMWPQIKIKFPPKSRLRA